MTAYTVTGHPLNYADLRVANTDALRNTLQAAGVGTTINLTLTGPDDTKLKNHRVLK